MSMFGGQVPGAAPPTPTHPTLTRVNMTALVVVSFVSAALVVMLARVLQLQLRPPVELGQTVGTRMSTQRDAAVRGDIMDRRGRLLSVTRFGYRLVVDPTLVERSKLEARKKPISLDEIIYHISAISGRPMGVVGGEIMDALRENQNRRELLASGGLPPDAIEDGALETPEPPEHSTQDTVDPIRPPELATSPDLPLVLKRPLRYLPMSGVLSAESVERFKTFTYPGVTLERVPVREYPGGNTVASLVGKLGTDKNGTVGAERMLGDTLEGTPGEVRFVRDAAGNPLWISPGAVRPATHGSDVKLSIDLEIQRIAGEEILRGVNEYQSAGGRVLVFDPVSGEILAMVDILRAVPDAIDYPFVDIGSKPSPGAPEYVPDRRYKVIAPDPIRDKHPALGRNRCVESVYEPGSTFKPFVWSVVTESGRMLPSDVVNTENGTWTTAYHRTIIDVKAKASQTWTDVLIHSSNIGMGKGAEKLSFAELHNAVKRWGFGQRTGIGLPGEATGLVTSQSNWKITSQHSVAFGNEVAVTPIQMVRAFSAFAREGELAGTMPQVRILAQGPDERNSQVIYRVIPEKVAMLTRDAMTHVAENMETALANRSPSEKDWRYAIFGKSGTSRIPVGKAPPGKRLPHGTKGYIDKQYISSFIAGGPVEAPRLVVLVTIDDPCPELAHTSRAYGSLTAGPVNRRIM
ncbi:MAG: penicillin-binding protein 2, partial [Planctomycetota bacterium]